MNQTVDIPPTQNAYYSNNFHQNFVNYSQEMAHRRNLQKGLKAKFIKIKIHNQMKNRLHNNYITGMRNQDDFISKHLQNRQNIAKADRQFLAKSQV